ncbi:MAG: aminopeptidase [Myxococcales bacterium FL481]|nr:MAG: aminopeptidase [Myxococcales bacterium FL481]
MTCSLRSLTTVSPIGLAVALTLGLMACEPLPWHDDPGTVPDDDDDDDDGTLENCDDFVPPPGPECEATDIQGMLECIPGMTVHATQAHDHGTEYLLFFKQPVNHADPDGPTFSQRLLLRHVDQAAPLVLKTSGYNLVSSWHELASMFGANVLSFEYRYFASSTPQEPIPWEHLTVKQAAHDSHRLFEALKWIYPAAWVNTGASKGGGAAVFHRRFHPCDVEATVAYVAPILYGTTDERFVDFLADVGGEPLAECRAALQTVQRELLTRRAAMLLRMNTAQYFRLGGPEVAFEHAVIELPFIFFQYYGEAACPFIPTADASDDIIFDYANQIAISWMSDGALEFFAPYYYQAATELGAPAVDMSHIEDLLKHADTYTVHSYLPPGVAAQHDSAAMLDIRDWVEHEGERLMFVYGEYDPWSAGAFDLGQAQDSFLYTEASGTHGATISSLSSDDREQALTALERWLDTTRVRERVAREPNWRQERRLRP